MTDAPRWLRSACLALAVLDVAWCCAALVTPGLPGWKMFATVAPADVTLVDRDGRRVDLLALVPRGAWIVDEQQLARVAVWACRRDPSRAPYVIREPGRAPRTLAAGTCAPE